MLKQIQHDKIYFRNNFQNNDTVFIGIKTVSKRLNC